MRFLVLYEELATYFLTCLNHLAETESCEILLFMKKVNSVAPFDFKNAHKNIIIKEREHFTDDEIMNEIKKFKPDFTYISGWMHKPYLQYIRTLKLQNVIIGFDNQYTGSIKQQLGAIYFKLFLKKHFKAAFVPGELQVTFAKKLGFKDQLISKNVYCCDQPLYSSYYQKTLDKKQNNLPKRFLFVGRYVKEKGLDILWESFIELQNEDPNEWELWCIGKGNLEPVSHPKINHLGFIQPNDFLPIIEQTGVFVLPSNFEPWGVVIHEFASAGYPMISTIKVGATEQFLKDAQNGYLITPDNKPELKNALKKIVSLTDDALVKMSRKSVELSKNITPQIWKESILKLAYAK
jgi:glycosyltransferase involved in cell wall biosynthesis